MARKKKIKKSAAKRAPTRKEVRDDPGIGHNMTQFRKLLVPFVKNYISINEKMEEDMAGYRGEIAGLMKNAANELGVKQSLVTKECRRILKNKREEEKEKALAEDERDQIDMIRASLEGTPFGDWAAGQLAASAHADDGDGDSDAADAAQEEAEEAGAT